MEQVLLGLNWLKVISLIVGMEAVGLCSPRAEIEQVKAETEVHCIR